MAITRRFCLRTLKYSGDGARSIARLYGRAHDRLDLHDHAHGLVLVPPEEHDSIAEAAQLLGAAAEVEIHGHRVAADVAVGARL